MKNKPELSIDRLRSLLSYDKETGLFTWLKNVSNIKAGAVAGTPTGKGYIGIRIDGVAHYAHRLAIFYVTGSWPEGEVDHENMVKTDNRYKNLRPASSSQNKMNRKAKADNRLGVKGVSFDSRVGRYQARIKAGGRERTIGVYDTIEEAAAAYARAANDNFGEFARTA